MEQLQEFRYILSFADEGGFNVEAVCNQLRGLWTAYCLHNELDVDTRKYDCDLMTIWEHITATEGRPVNWSDYNGFDSYMCSDLV